MRVAGATDIGIGPAENILTKFVRLTYLTISLRFSPTSQLPILGQAEQSKPRREWADEARLHTIRRYAPRLA